MTEQEVQEAVYSAAEKAYDPEKHVLPEYIVSTCVSAALSALADVLEDEGPLYRSAAKTVRNIVV